MCYDEHMTFQSVCGNYGFSTVYEDFTNQQSGPRNFRVVKVVVDRLGNEYSRTNEVIAVDAGQKVVIYQNANNYDTVTFKLFRRDYSVDGTYDEVKIWEKTYDAPFSPIGPR